MSPYHWGFCYAAFCKQANVARQQSSQDQQYRRNIGTALTGLGAVSALGSGVAGGIAAVNQLSPDAPWQKQYHAELNELPNKILAELEAKPEFAATLKDEAELKKYTDKKIDQVRSSAGSNFRSALWRGLRVPALAGVGSLGLMGTGMYLRSTS